LDLEKLRFGNRLNVLFEMEGQIADKCVPPLILILFLENSFKHGVKNILAKIDIEISLKVKDGFLFFQVKNPVAQHNTGPGNMGIGLKNVRRRLELLYGDTYKLDTVENDNKYVASLKMPV